MVGRQDLEIIVSHFSNIITDRGEEIIFLSRFVCNFSRYRTEDTGYTLKIIKIHIYEF